VRVLARALAALLSLAAAFAPGAVRAEQPWRMRHEHPPVRYLLDVELIETGAGVRLKGKETVFWENTSRDAVKSLYFHLYANAFRDKRSTFLREATRDGFEIPDDMKYGEMQIASLEVDGVQATPQFVEPGGRPTIKIEFTLEMPRLIRRMGAHADFVMAAQWFPKLGRYLGLESTAKNLRDGWYCHQYHANTEFSADFADFDVTVRTPVEYVLGATGMPQGEDAFEEKGGVKVRRRRYRAESVVDFAWTAGKRLKESVHDVAPVKAGDLEDPVGREVRRVQDLVGGEDAALPTVQVVLLLQPEHEDQKERYVEAARVALGMFGAWLGPYPAQRLTIVDPPWSGRAAGGMEYPTLVTGGTVDGSPPQTHRPEGVTVHEIGHQWLMWMLANNEAEEAWLDEGVNTYLTTQAMRLAYDRRGGGFAPAQESTTLLGFHFEGVPVHDYPGLSAGWPDLFELPGWARPPRIDVFRIVRDLPWLTHVRAGRYAERQDALLPDRRRVASRAGLDEMVKAGWLFADRRSYAANAYSRPALFLHTLRKTLVAERGEAEGERLFVLALRQYARDWRFRHPTTDDFLRSFKETTKLDPTPLAEQLVRTASVLDYSVESVRPTDEPGDPDRKAVAPKSKPKETVVRVRRRGSSVVPIVLEAEREDKTSERVVWDVARQSKETWRDFAFPGEVVVARLDPDGVYLQDVNLSDQTRAVKPNARPALKWSVRFLGWFENALTTYGRFF
jgi:hypothetical protein